MILKNVLTQVLKIISGNSLQNRGAILMYHSIDHNAKFSTVPTEVFEAHLRYLAESALRVVPLSALVDSLRMKGDLTGMVALTFDDGYRDFYTTVFPLLKKYHFHATIFVPTGTIGETVVDPKSGVRFPIVNELQLQEMAESGYVSCMPHTVHHTKLHSISFEDACKEIEDSREQLEAIIGKQANIFSYPSGRYTDSIVGYLRDSGRWLAAVTVDSEQVTHTANLFALPRIAIDSSVDINRFKFLLSHAYAWYIKLKKALI